MSIDNSFLINDSELSNIKSNDQSNVTEEKEKKINIEENENESEEEDCKILNEYLSKIECNENCKVNILKTVYLMYSCFVDYKCENHGNKFTKFNEYFDKKKIYLIKIII